MFLSLSANSLSVQAHPIASSISSMSEASRTPVVGARNILNKLKCMAKDVPPPEHMEQNGAHLNSKTAQNIGYSIWATSLRPASNTLITHTVYLSLARFLSCFLFLVGTPHSLVPILCLACPEHFLHHITISPCLSNLLTKS